MRRTNLISQFNFFSAFMIIQKKKKHCSMYFLFLFVRPLNVRFYVVIFSVSISILKIQFQAAHKFMGSRCIRWVPILLGSLGGCLGL